MRQPPQSESAMTEDRDLLAVRPDDSISPAFSLITVFGKKRIRIGDKLRELFAEDRLVQVRIFVPVVMRRIRRALANQFAGKIPDAKIPPRLKLDPAIPDLRRP